MLGISSNERPRRLWPRYAFGIVQRFTMWQIPRRMQRAGRTDLPGLTGLRGIGAIWVVIHHAQYGFDLPIASAGYLGVDLFFILSGFVLSHAHQEGVWRWATYFRFLRARFARIFPLHWAALLLVVVTIVICPRILEDMPDRFHWPELVSSIFLVQSWGLGRPAAWNVPAWSLSTEWLVSIAFPAFLYPARQIARPEVAAILCFSCLGAFAVFLWLTSNPSPNVVARAGIVRTICEFAAGCLLYRLYATGWKPNLCVAILGATLVLGGVLSPETKSIISVFGFPILIVLATLHSHPVGKLLSTRPLVFLGEISFSIYLLHWILLQASDRWREAAGASGGVRAFAWFCGYFAFVIMLSTMSYRLIEVPARQRLRMPHPNSRSFTPR